MAAEVVGWDVGGAHLKAARLAPDGRLARVTQAACPLWLGLGQLTPAHRLCAKALDSGGNALHVVTMSGELADCFRSRAEGVAAIVAEMRRLLGRPFLAYAGTAGIMDASEAAGRPERVASMNWHATASWTAQRAGDGLLLDIGSTTTDLAPFRGKRVQATAHTDAGRMRAGELLYTGVTRTPVMAIADRFRIGGTEQPVMAEYFAATADVYRLLGELPERADQHPACDQGEKTPRGSARRLARMFGRDYEEPEFEYWRAAARAIATVQQRRIAAGVRRLLAAASHAAPAAIVGAGSGCFLARQVAGRAARRHACRFLRFGELLGPAPQALRERANDCAAAVSVACLAQRLAGAGR